MPFDEIADESGATAIQAEFDADGKYRLPADAVVGKYRVIIQPRYAEKVGEEARNATKSGIPLLYADPEQSGLVEEVTPRENVIDFELKR